ncbi:MAG: hypothetical protein E7678_07370 [Ruminococcaceae bacterium]|nr:hypothetical protein [Oscillospiraceae bacterium]
MKKSLRIIALAMVALMLMLTLASCGAPKSDPDKAVKALEKNGYTAQKMDGGEEDLECTVIGMSEDLKNRVTIAYYKTTDAAKKALDDANENKDQLKAVFGDDVIIKRSGKMVYAGTKDAIKAAS